MCCLSYQAISDLAAPGARWDMMQMTELAAKGTKAFGAANTWGMETGRKMGKMIGGLNVSDIQLLPPAAMLGALESANSTFMDMPFDAMANIVSRIKDADVFGTVDAWTADSLKTLGPFSKQALGSDLGALSAAAFAGSMDVMEAIGSWSDAETITLASKFKESTGANMTAWTKEQVAKGGKFITGLAASDLSALPAEAVAGLKPTAMMGMDAVKAAAFSADQFKKMSASARDQVSFDKLDKLSADQRKVREAREEGES
jgi:hypothetical protein